MEITHTTVPGSGTVYHLATRDGVHFGVLVADTDRHLLIYGDESDRDAPTQTIILEQDEANQVAEILYDRSISDRLADLERRFAQAMGEAT
ncbi:MAG TPA: hypothetical protein VIR33_10955 [Thermopolyspora sp.]